MPKKKKVTSFHIYDRNGDGIISAEEAEAGPLTVAFHPKNPKDSFEKELIEQVDKSSRKAGDTLVQSLMKWTRKGKSEEGENIGTAAEVFQHDRIAEWSDIQYEKEDMYEQKVITRLTGRRALNQMRADNEGLVDPDQQRMLKEHKPVTLIGAKIEPNIKDPSDDRTIKKKMVSQREFGEKKVKFEGDKQIKNSSAGLNRICGVEYYNSIWYRVPLLNLLVPLLAQASSDTPAWDQIAALLEIVSITASISLALVCSFHSAVAYADIDQTNLRYSANLDDFWNYKVFCPMNGDAPEIPDDYNFYASTNCTNPSASGCSDPRNSVYWASKFGSFSICAEDADERFTTLCPKSDYSTKCFADRGLDIDNSRITGNYARWWAEEQAESGTSYSVVEIFNQYCVISTTLLSAALLLAVVMLGTGSAHVFTRPGIPDSYQRDSVLSAYFFWLRFPVLVSIIFVVGGLLVFFLSLPFLVYIKFSDPFIERNGRNHEFFQIDNPYGYTDWFINLGMWIPIFVLLMVASKAQHSAYMYPSKPYSNEAKTQIDDKLFRYEAVNQLAAFLSYGCGLPSTHAYRPMGPSNNVTDVFLSTAAGIPAPEAEVVAHILVDAGIDSWKVLRDVINVDATWVRDLPGMSVGAVCQIHNAIKVRWNAIEDKKSWSDELLQNYEDGVDRPELWGQDLLDRYDARQDANERKWGKLTSSDGSEKQAWMRTLKKSSKRPTRVNSAVYEGDEWEKANQNIDSKGVLKPEREDGTK